MPEATTTQRGHAHDDVVHVNRDGFRDAARVVVTSLDYAAAAPSSSEAAAHAVAAMAVWSSLTGLAGERAVDHAHVVAAS